MFDFDNVRYTTVQLLAEDILQLSRRRSEILLGYLGTESSPEMNGTLPGENEPLKELIWCQSEEENGFVQGLFSSRSWIKLPAMFSGGHETISTRSNLVGPSAFCRQYCLLGWIQDHLPASGLNFFFVPPSFLLLFLMCHNPRTVWAEIFAQISWIGQHMYLCCLCVTWQIDDPWCLWLCGVQEHHW